MAGRVAGCSFSKKGGKEAKITARGLWWGRGWALRNKREANKGEETRGSSKREKGGNTLCPLL